MQGLADILRVSLKWFVAILENRNLKIVRVLREGLVL